MQKNIIDYEAESKYLQTVTDLIDIELQSSENDGFRAQNSVSEMKKYLWENKEEVDSAEKVSMQAMIAQRESSYFLAQKRFRTLNQIKNAPYFARIDFKDDEYDEMLKVYIGLVSVSNDETLDYYVYDWRSPIGSLYYDYGVGRAEYKAPIGQITGDISLKRQYKISNRELDAVVDSDLNIDDSMLLDTLSGSTKNNMRNIVNSIQEEQNKVIRNEKDKVLVVEGPAGCGKTSVALHRIAYLLYKERKILSANNILIFSPSNVFSKYIAKVLPELGEENVLETTFGSYIKTYLDEFNKVETFIGQTKRIYESTEECEHIITLKMSNKIKDAIDNYLKRYEKTIKFYEYVIDEKVVITKDEAKNLFENDYTEYPIRIRQNKIVDRAIMFADNGKFKKQKIKTIKNRFLNKNSIITSDENLYINMFKDKEFLEELNISKDFADEILIKLDMDFEAKEIKYEDAIILSYIKGMTFGFEKNSMIKHIVIDEAQDYNEMQYHMIKKIFRNAKFTILGDANQAINPYVYHKDLTFITKLFEDKNSKVLNLTKCYRSSYEITNFTNALLELQNVNPIQRETTLPEIKIGNIEENIISDLKEMENKGYKQVAVICKSSKDVEVLYEVLKDKVENVNRINTEDEEYKEGVTILPSYLSKGLEFDAVLSYIPASNTYELKDKRLLYVVFTRALHEVNIYTNDEKINILEGISKDKYNVKKLI